MQELGLGPQGLRAPASALPECFQGHRAKWCLLVESFWHQQPGRWEWGKEEATVTSKARRGCSGPLEPLTPKYNELFTLWDAGHAFIVFNLPYCVAFPH